MTSQSPHSFLCFSPDLTTHRTHAGLGMSSGVFPTTPQKSQHNVEFSKCYIIQPHKITSENTSIGDIKTQKWNYSTIQQENRSLKVNPIRTQLMTNWQKTNSEVKRSQCVKQLSGFGCFLVLFPTYIVLHNLAT